MKHGKGRKGFSLIELMIVIAVVAILVALAMPSYEHYVQKAKRSKAQQLLLNWTNIQELYRATHHIYADDSAIPPPKYTDKDNNDIYEFSAEIPHPVLTNNGYLLKATPQGKQADDKEKGTDCDELTIDAWGLKEPTECWPGAHGT